MPAEAIDVVLALGVCWLAWRLLADRDLVRSAILFIAFGLLLALAWVRLDAPDLALAEAAIGAGVTGVLFLDAAGALRRGKPDRARGQRPARRRLAVLGWIAGALTAAGVAIALIDIPADAPGLTDEVTERLPETTVTNPVTGVLLSLRAWDTLLEVAVLLVGAAGVLALRGEWSVRMIARRRPDPLLAAFGRVAAPVVLLISGYLVWLGGTDPGGAFQGGALLGAMVLILALAGVADPARLGGVWQRLALVVGTGAFVAAALVTTAAGPAPIGWPHAIAYETILAIETAVALSVGASLGALVLVAKPPRLSEEAPDVEEEA
jgi:multisubunit Na+/H+ antiporter MnhB subunit